MNNVYELKRMRSATAPTTRPGVMMANINWKNANRGRGMELAPTQGSPFITSLKKKKVRGSPMKPPIDLPKQRLNCTTIHKTEMIPAETVLLIIVESTFLRPTIPP